MRHSDKHLFIPSMIVLFTTAFTAAFSASGLGQDPEWKNIGPGAETITSIIEDVSDTSVVFLTTASSGLLMSTDAGGSWSRKDIGLPVQRVNNVVQDPDAGQRLYAGTERGTYKSIDSGDTWYLMSGGEMDTTGSFIVTVNPGEPSWIFAASQGDGVFRSNSFGEFWTRASSGLPPLNYVDLEVDPNLNNNLYSASDQFGLFRGLNGADELTWVQKNEGLTNTSLRSFYASPPVPGLIFAGTSSGGFFRSTNFGDQWSVSGTGLPQIDISALAVLDTDPATLLAGTLGRGIYASTDNGDSFVPFSSLLSHHDIVTLTTRGTSTIYAGTDKDGVFISRDGGTSWSLANSGLTGGNVIALAISGGSSHRLYAGLSDGENDVLVSSNWGNSWELRQQGLPVFTSISDFWLSGIDGTAYACTDSGVFVTADYGMSWSPRNTGLSEITSKIAGSPHDENLLFAVASGIYRSTDGGGSWTAAQTGIVGSPLSIIVSPSGTDTVYTGTKPIGPDGGGVFKSTDRGDSWFEANNGMEAGESVFALTVDQGDPSIVFAGTASGVFRSSNGGQTWFPRRNGLPLDFIASDIIIDDSNQERLFTSSLTYGVYISTDSGESWTSLHNGLETGVTRLAQNPVGPDSIFAATDGEGIFLIDLTPSAIEDDVPDGGIIPRTLALMQNYPNPFNPHTTIAVSIDTRSGVKSRGSAVSLRIYDLRGRPVKTLVDGFLSAGVHHFDWKGRDERGLPVSSGTYFVVLSKDGETVKRKMSLLR